MPNTDMKAIDLPQAIMAKRADLSRQRDEVKRLRDDKSMELQKYTLEGPAIIRWLRGIFSTRLNTLIGEKLALDDKLTSVDDSLFELPENPVESSIESLKAQVFELEKELSEPIPVNKRLNPVEEDEQRHVRRERMSKANKIVALNELISYKQDQLNSPVITMPVETVPSVQPEDVSKKQSGAGIFLKARELFFKLKSAAPQASTVVKDKIEAARGSAEKLPKDHEIPIKTFEAPLPNESESELSQKRQTQSKLKAGVRVERTEEFFELAKIAHILSFDEVHLSEDKPSASFKVPSDGSHDDFMDFCDNHDIDYSCRISTRPHSDRVQITVQGTDLDKLVRALGEKLNQNQSVFVPTSSS